MSASNPAPEPTEIAGRFEVLQKLGAGAFGTVYKAKDKVLGRLLAIKTIRLEGLAASQAGLGEMLDRFRREAQVAAQLKHPNIVTIYDIGESEGMSYLSMELIDGDRPRPRDRRVRPHPRRARRGARGTGGGRPRLRPPAAGSSTATSSPRTS